MTTGLMKLPRLAGGCQIECAVRQPADRSDSRRNGQEEGKSPDRRWPSVIAGLHALVLAGGSAGTGVYFSAYPPTLLPLSAPGGDAIRDRRVARVPGTQASHQLGHPAATRCRC